MGPETSMEVQAALGSDIALAFDECTPFHVERDYTARSMERTHRWLDRCVELAPRARARATSCSSASSRAASTRTCGPSRPRTWPAPRVDGDRDRRLARPGEGADARGGGLVAARAAATSRRGTCSASATWTTSSTRSAPGSTPSTAPRPRAWRATAPRWCRDPETPLAARPDEGRRTGRAASRSPTAARARPAASTRAATCTTCRGRASSPAKRLLTLHNLTFMERLMAAPARRRIECAATTPARGEPQRECSPMKSRSPSICCCTSPLSTGSTCVAARRGQQRDGHRDDRRDRRQQREEGRRSGAGAAAARAASRLARGGGRGACVRRRRGRRDRRRHARARRVAAVSCVRCMARVASGVAASSAASRPVVSPRRPASSACGHLERASQ